jgi:hypothetical protein
MNESSTALAGEETLVKAEEVVSTHVLVEHEKLSKLKELSKKTRVAQSEYLREAVDDLLQKYADKVGA